MLLTKAVVGWKKLEKKKKLKCKHEKDKWQAEEIINNRNNKRNNNENKDERKLTKNEKKIILNDKK